MDAAVARRAERATDEPPAPAPAQTSLFRHEVMEEQQTQWLGTVLVAPNLSATLFALFAAAAVASVLALLVLGQFTQKARISGWLVPELGAMRIFAPQPGRVAKLHVREGDRVAKGAPLVRISSELETEALGRTRHAAVQQLALRRDSLAAERERQGRLSALQERESAERIAALKAERENLAREIELQTQRLRLAEQASERQLGLRAKGITTERNLEDAEVERLRQSAELHELERDALINERDRLALEARLRELPLQRDAKLGEIDRSVATLSQEIAEAEAQREIVVTAPQDGVVTHVRSSLGGDVRADAPLLSIMPEGSKLTAELFTSSRAIGFVRSGQEVLLRYQAYPYQKFGSYRGTVAQISRSAVSPSELSPQLAGLTSLFAADEPVYRIEVTPERQSATAYGVPAPLQAGMQLEADILIERRRLYEWMLDPLFTLTGRRSA
ncbi:HlyD family secretion protein [Hansschlegelia zhihuaiae]|uniref:HlyD family efflux transporter periplasmic adaptor subunit n=1 Tax=Hansschlegelia zhihuaiae TaxID=405005 RepID=A0A4Q0MJU3_9HYPH|nr:HlyD family efflux transporter periplasmic adaptor subunit [Hansschlegelia zhihuaiae]RXF73735.1 HlyD family efflux transporter periplasmic adaptor subunit [Hansschlegelia zhihuaiae]